MGTDGTCWALATADALCQVLPGSIWLYWALTCQALAISAGLGQALVGLYRILAIFTGLWGVLTGHDWL
jgi:hypothetical protein